jgi:hypothetical protein
MFGIHVRIPLSNYPSGYKKFYYRQEPWFEVGSPVLQAVAVDNFTGPGKIKTEFLMKEHFKEGLGAVEASTYMEETCTRLEHEFFDLLGFYRLGKFSRWGEASDQSAPKTRRVHNGYKYNCSLGSSLKIKFTFTDMRIDGVDLRLDVAISYRFHHLNYLLWGYEDGMGGEVVYPHSDH